VPCHTVVRGIMHWILLWCSLSSAGAIEWPEIHKVAVSIHMRWEFSTTAVFDHPSQTKLSDASNNVTSLRQEADGHDLMRIPMLIIRHTLIPCMLGTNMFCQVRTHDRWGLECAFMLFQLILEIDVFYHSSSTHIHWCDCSAQVEKNIKLGGKNVPHLCRSSLL